MWWIVQPSVEDDGVEGAVELAVAAAAESMSGAVSARGEDRSGAGETREGGATVEQKANELLAQVDAYRELSSSLAIDELEQAIKQHARMTRAWN